MKIIKRFKISQVVIEPKNIKELADKVYKEYEQDKKDPKCEYARIRFILRSQDGTQYEDNKLEIFSEGGILQSRKIIAIELSYYVQIKLENELVEKGISIETRHVFSDESLFNQVVITGYDEGWTNGCLKTIEEIVAYWKKQEIWVDKYHLHLIILFSLGICWLFNILLDIFFPHFRSTGILLLNFFISYAMWGFFMVGFPIAIYIVRKMSELYPAVELALGPEYLQEERRKRRRLYNLMTIGFSPIAISLLTGLITYFFKHILGK